MKRYIVASRKIPRVGNKKIKDWYMKKYPTDGVGEELNPDSTFNDLIRYLDFGLDVYDCLGSNVDSIVRERVFSELANKMQVDYMYIYNLWLNDGYSDEFESSMKEQGYI